MVVHPDMQGRGIGSSALLQVLNEANDAGLPLLLGTQEEEMCGSTCGRGLRLYEQMKLLGIPTGFEGQIVGIGFESYSPAEVRRQLHLGKATGLSCSRRNELLWASSNTM
eukprot:scaffold1619_cov144-Skeletonema_menzelii.AAC.1